MKRLRYMAAGLALLGLAGCITGDRGEWYAVQPGQQMGDVTMFRDIQFSDIPLPTGYRILANESYSFQGQLFRNGILKYHGPVESSYAVTFFRRHLPRRGWRFERMDRGFGNRVLYFTKGQERLIVIVIDITGGSRVEFQLDNIDKNDLLLKGRLGGQGF